MRAQSVAAWGACLTLVRAWCIYDSSRVGWVIVMMSVASHVYILLLRAMLNDGDAGYSWKYICYLLR